MMVFFFFFFFFLDEPVAGCLPLRRGKEKPTSFFLPPSPSLLVIEHDMEIRSLLSPTTFLSLVGRQWNTSRTPPIPPVSLFSISGRGDASGHPFFFLSRSDERQGDALMLLFSGQVFFLTAREKCCIFFSSTNRDHCSSLAYTFMGKDHSFFFFPSFFGENGRRRIIRSLLLIRWSSLRDMRVFEVSFLPSLLRNEEGRENIEPCLVQSETRSSLPLSFFPRC